MRCLILQLYAENGTIKLAMIDDPNSKQCGSVLGLRGRRNLRIEGLEK